MSKAKSKTNATHNSEDYLRMYRQMVRIRAFEDNANQLYLSAKMPGLTHMYSGQEAVAVGICEALRDSDKITSTHRGHGHCVAKGAEFKEHLTVRCKLANRVTIAIGGPEHAVFFDIDGVGAQREAALIRLAPLAEILTLPVEHGDAAFAHFVLHGQRMCSPMFDIPGKEIDNALIVHRDTGSHFELHVGGVTGPLTVECVTRPRVIVFGGVVESDDWFDIIASGDRGLYRNVC